MPSLKNKAALDSLPVIPLRDTVVFPNFVIPLFIGRQTSIDAIEMAFSTGSPVFLVAQKDPSIDNVSESDLYTMGTVCRIDDIVKMNDGTVKALVNGIYRANVKKYALNDDILFADTFQVEINASKSKDHEGIILACISHFESFIRASKKMPIDILSSISSIQDPEKLADTIASYLPLKVNERQDILETLSVDDRLEKVILFIEEKSELSNVEKKIKNRVKKQVEKNQKEYYLNEQLKAIYRELGDQEDLSMELKGIEDKIHKSKMPKEAKEKAMQEMKKLKHSPAISQESGIIRSYIDWLLSIPWVSSKKSASIKEAERILNESHYGLEKVKERIMEYLAVLHRVPKIRSQILCFVGPPGVGKTSLGKSIAEATNKEFARIALGGVSDEADIRGHRRTYIGAMPGKIIQAMRKVKSLNSIIMLDEIDKLGADWRGDPASALLEVLDPEQNCSFMDHYIDTPYDLSETVFITTANSLDIPHALLDRMEIINISGYTEEEKLHIAKNHILGKQIAQAGLNESEISISDDAILGIIRDYTMESGLRNLEREISKIARKSVLKIDSDPNISNISITKDNYSEFLGIKRYTHLKANDSPAVGISIGLAWTEFGGDVLSIEALLLPGSGNIISTGKLGEVMQESIKAAYSYAKSMSPDLGLDEEVFSKNDIHIHVPEGAVPKDGPSAGVTICTSIFSVLTGKKVRSDIAMTGEITLIGKVLAIGGLKEKILAAKRSGIQKVFIPKENEKDLQDLPKSLLESIEIQCVSHIKEILDEVFV